MAMTKKSMEILFDRLYHNQYENIPEILQGAIDEYRTLLSEIDRDERRKVSYIKSVIDYCDAQRWGLARNQLEPAEQEYYRYFFRRLNPVNKIKRSSITDRPTDSDSRRGSRRLDTRDGRSRPSSYTNVPNVQTDLAGRPSSEYIQQTTKKPSRVTNLSDLSTAQKIAEKFGEIYQNEWAGALDELEHLKIYEKNAISCLLRIVLDAYRVCVVEADTQIAKLEDAAHNIMLEGIYTQEEKLRGHRSFLTAYRRGIADVCLERLQETFRRRYLPEIIRGIGVYQNVRTHGNVLLYANQCVAICWAMAILDPQVYVVDDRDSRGHYSVELYNKYVKIGQSIAFYVWPPLRTHKDGKLLSKGIAEGR